MGGEVKTILRVYWFGRWFEVRNHLFQGADVPPFDPNEKPTSGDFRRFEE